MNRIPGLCTVIVTAILISSSISCSQKTPDPVDYVNPYMGNISHLLVPTYPTVHLPNSMLRFYPERDNYTTNKMAGFPLNVVSHRSGTVFMIIPFSGSNAGEQALTPFTTDNEKISPYRYSVTLDERNIGLEFSPAARAGFFRLKFNDSPNCGVVITTGEGGKLSCGEKVVSGYDIFRGVKTYLFLEFERAPRFDNITPGDQGTGAIGSKSIVASCTENGNGEMRIRYGISYISEEQARKNLEAEIGEWDIDKVEKRARDIWNKTLSVIEVEGGTDDQRHVFYTSLYRCFERMVDITEDGRYFSVWSGQIESAGDTAFYTDDWVWDTYLAMHPLQVILNPGTQDEKITSYIRMARQSGWMPTFPTPTGDHHAMNGNHSAAVILDAWNKGIRGFDLEEAYRHLKHTVLNETKLPWIRGKATRLDRFYDENGYFPGLLKGETEPYSIVNSFERRQSVAVTLASAYDDWCLAQMAKELGRKDDYDFFIKRSLNYRNLFNTETGFYHPKDSLGRWIEPFDYRFDSGTGARDYYDENNAWTYIWQTYHAFDDLIRMMGGKEKLGDKLDQLFSEGLGRTKWIYYSTFPDATGNVGQFVMGNEPSMHIPYLYNLAGTPWKAQKRLRMLMDTWFRNDLMGVPGDEDGGGLSAFYVFSAMGFYPIAPGIPEYQIGSPLFKKIRIKLQNGRTFNVIAENNSQANKYVQSAWLNGKELGKTSFTHSDITEGGTLILKMGDKPDYRWGVE